MLQAPPPERLKAKYSVLLVFGCADPLNEMDLLIVADLNILGLSCPARQIQRLES